MRMLLGAVAGVTAMLALAGCGGGGGGNATSEVKAAPGAASAGGSGYVGTDACATLPKEKVAAVAGVAVTGAELRAVTEPTATTAGFSTCSYSFADGGTLDFFTRQAPTEDNTPDAIQQSRQSLIDNMGAKVTDVPGLGTAAFEADKMQQLHVFFGGNRYFFFMTPKPPKARPIAEVERALAAEVLK